MHFFQWRLRKIQDFILPNRECFIGNRRTPERHLFRAAIPK
jgi:hypothetical protein